jgi:hypothetical protein
LLKSEFAANVAELDVSFKASNKHSELRVVAGMCSADKPVHLEFSGDREWDRHARETQSRFILTDAVASLETCIRPVHE